MPELSSLSIILPLAFALGLLHALDADHIMAVTALTSGRPRRGAALRFCLRWALGHGVVLFILGSAVILLGMVIPPVVGRVAEAMIGLMLLIIGTWMLWDVWRSKAHIHFHRHDGLPEHAHWHHHANTREHATNAHEHRHSALWVGMLHGTAGSAPLLALLPLSVQHSPWMGMTYLLVFSLGVLSAMILFGGLLNFLFARLRLWGNGLLRGARVLMALASFTLGGYWLYAAA